MNIVGAGLAGLIAAHAWQRASVIEAAPEPRLHRALLRFRSPALGDFLGIPFRPVTVRKGIWMDGRFHAPDIGLANLYSQKCIGILADRSIWNIDAVQRWIAPEDLQEQLLERVAPRIAWGTPMDFHVCSPERPTISTAPLGAAARAVSDELPEFSAHAIHTERWRVHGGAVHQTVYFPSPRISAYRASITGDLLTVEHARGVSREFPQEVLSAFALCERDVEFLDQSTTRFGKIAAIDDTHRKRLILALTQQRGIYSLGRFATWRPGVLLDDLLHDIAVIRRLMAASHYDRTLIGA